MAEQIPYGVTVCLINRLVSSAFVEFGRIYGVRDELAKLKETIEFINARLLDAEEKQEQDQSHAVKYWISRLKKVLHDADDLFDDFVIEDLREKVDGHGKIVRKVRNFFSGSNPIVFRSNMARKIEAIQKKFNDVANDMFKLNFRQGDRVFKENVSEWRKTSSFVEESEIIGREESKKEVVNLLMQTNSNQNVSLIAVVGVGGLGKTALAQLVYNDAEVQKFFSKQMWVCVSEDFEVETLLKKILKSHDDKSIVDHLELDQLQKKLRQSLSGQRYLLVLDDVWNKSYENWDRLRSSLTSCATGSKILVTTRLEEVAKTMSVSTPYLLGGLSKKQSLTLFKKLTFGEDAKTIDPSLLSIGEKIVEKCEGVPLAIRAIGSLLRTKNEENEWLNILDGDIWRLSEDTKRVMAVLKLSYKHLPIELRQCFAYCCLYPKDSILEKDKLVQLWMAQGYIECSTGMKCMEDVGNDYVKILLMRSFFQDVEMDEYGDIKYFKMHDLMRDLAMDVAGTDCYLHSEGKRIVGTPTHLWLDKGVSIPSDLLDANRVRTILWPSKWRMFNYYSQMKELSIIWKFKSLRAVNLCGLHIRELPRSIGRLKHLRYLELSDCRELTRLPENISNLVQLQTLKLKGCKELKFFVGITKLISLRHFVPSSYTTFRHGMPAGLGKLKSLQMLEEFVVGKDPKFAKLNELKELNHLRGKLCIKNLGLIKDVGLESKDVNLKEKKNLRSLELDWGFEDNKNDDSLVLLENLHPPENLKELIMRNYRGVRYPSWICSLTNIVSISLYDYPHLPRLDQLPFLKHLDISHMRDDVWCEYISCFSSSSLPTPISTSFFPSLETLHLNYCGQNELIVLPPFPRLSSLSIRYCSQLTCMPTFPHLVEKLELWKCSVKPLIDTLKMNKATLTQEANPKPSLVTNDSLHSCSFTPLSKLKHLEIQNVDLIGIKELPEEWMQNLISLERLRIPFQAPLFRSMHHLPAALQKLTIDFVTNNDDMYEAYKIEEVTTQGQPLHCLRSLQQIQVCGSRYMRELPEWICNISSLRHMTINNCWNLESLPKGMGHLTNLQSLEIPYSNPVLKERCQRETGADWPKIAHIPYINVNGDRM